MKHFETLYNDMLKKVPKNELSKVDDKTRREMYFAEQIIDANQKFETLQLEFEDFKQLMKNGIERRVNYLMSGATGNLDDLHGNGNIGE